MFPSEWKGSAESLSGTASFKIAGLDFAVRLDSFADYQMLNKMLDLAFYQGKRFAGTTIRSRVMNAMEEAERAHGL